MTTSRDIVADVGGTNTRVAFAVGSRVLPSSIQRFRNAEFENLEAVLSAFMTGQNVEGCCRICVAMAGPVRDGNAMVTNLGWSTSEAELRRITGAEFACLLNDLQALGHALGHIPQENLRSVLSGPKPTPGGPRLVVGVATGFNIASVHDFPSGRTVPASEKGYTTLPTLSAKDLDLAQFVSRFHGYPAAEEVLSGRGLQTIYQWLGGDEATGAAEIMAQAGTNDPRALEAVATFLRLLGTITGDLALEHVPSGGIFLAGSVARAMIPFYDTSRFSEHFRSKGKFSDFMDQFSIQIIEDDYAPLLGTAAHLSRQKTHKTTLA